MGITLKQRDESTVICLGGDIDISSAAELKKAFVDALKPGRAVLVSLDSNTDLDVTAIQLLWAAEQKAKASGVKLGLDGQVPEKVSAALKDEGFEEFPFPA